jgi:adenylate cyclase 9
LRINLDAIVRCSLLTEHTLISKMIDSLMPKKYARGIMEDFDIFRERVQNVNIVNQVEDELQMATFRPLHIERMENVSILFADIVGFTSMSSNKSAAQLVSLLSDLYGRFDDLCVQMSCEKIATLGDCYYCVSGCPEPRTDHAKSCLLMGLAMINAIEEFDEDNNEQVDMRVGVHSGSVNCGIIGTIKYKFDIFSNDVTLANKMESTGKPGNLFIYIYSLECSQSLNPDNGCMLVCLSAQARDPVDRLDPRYLYIHGLLQKVFR